MVKKYLDIALEFLTFLLIICFLSEYVKITFKYDNISIFFLQYNFIVIIPKFKTRTPSYNLCFMVLNSLYLTIYKKWKYINCDFHYCVPRYEIKKHYNQRRILQWQNSYYMSIFRNCLTLNFMVSHPYSIYVVIRHLTRPTILSNILLLLTYTPTYSYP